MIAWEFDEVHVRCSGWSVSHLDLALWRLGQGIESQVKGEYCSQQLTCTCVVNSEQNYVEIWYWCRSRLNFGQMLQKDGQLPQAKPMLVAIVSKFSKLRRFNASLVQQDGIRDMVYLYKATCSKMQFSSLKAITKILSKNLLAPEEIGKIFLCFWRHLVLTKWV